MNKKIIIRITKGLILSLFFLTITFGTKVANGESKMPVKPVIVAPGSEGRVNIAVKNSNPVPIIPYIKYNPCEIIKSFLTLWCPEEIDSGEYGTITSGIKIKDNIQLGIITNLSLIIGSTVLAKFFHSLRGLPLYVHANG